MPAAGAAPLSPASGGLVVRVDDTDAAAAPNAGTGNDTVRVTVTSVLDQAIVDEETFEVPEVGGPAYLTGGRFERHVSVRFRTEGAGVHGDGVLDVRDGGQVRTGYVDLLGGQGETLATREPAGGPLPVAFTRSPVAITFPAEIAGDGSRGRIQPGDTLLVRVNDPDANLSPVPDTITVTLSTAIGLDAASDVESVKLVETGPATGAFTGSIATRLHAPMVRGDGVLQVRGRDVPGGPAIRATYASPSGAAAVRDLPVEMDGEAVLVAAASGAQLKLAVVRVGEPVVAQLTDDDVNVDPLARDSVDVTVRSFGTRRKDLVDTEVVRLTEDATDGGLCPRSAPRHDRRRIGRRRPRERPPRGRRRRPAGARVPRRRDRERPAAGAHRDRPGPRGTRHGGLPGEPARPPRRGRRPGRRAGRGGGEVAPGS